MQKLIDLTKDEKRVFVHLNSGKDMSDFLKQAEKEGFVINGRLPTHCKCEKIMIIHNDYTISYLHGFVIHAALFAGCTPMIYYHEITKK